MEFEYRLILAPMQGLTEVLFRRVYERVFSHALDVAISPFLSLTHGNLSDALKKIDDVLPAVNDGSMPVIPQILGKEPEEFVALGNRLYEFGYTEVNWNIGCPMRKVAGKHRGSGILPYPDEVRYVLDRVVGKMKPQLSVKMRLGYRSPDEIFELIPILNSYPLKNVTIHPRIGKQMYSGTPDMEKFEKALGAFRHEVIYNGDINTAERFHSLTLRYPEVHQYMLGRGVLYDPLLPLKIKGMPYSEQSVNVFIGELCRDILKLPVTDEAKVRKIKEYWCLLFKALHITEQQRDTVLHAAHLQEVLNALGNVCPTI